MYGIQLYSVKDFMEKGVEETLKQVAEMGYSKVELAGYYNVLMVVENEPTPVKQMAEAKVCIDYLKSPKD